MGYNKKVVVGEQVPEKGDTSLDGSPDDDDIKILKDYLAELGKHQALALKLIVSAEAAMAGGMAKGDIEVAELNLEQLRKAAEEAEDVSRSLSKAIKFGRLSWEGGFSKQNCKILEEQSADLSRRLSTCTKLIRALLPPIPRGP